MENPFETLKFERYAPIIVFCLGILLLMPGIWSETGITAKDEYWLSLRTPLETLARGDWLTTWVNGEPRLRKPPLLYWAIMAGYKTFGINLFAARIWGVLAGAGLAMCSSLMARKLFARDGLLAGLLTLAAIGVAVEARQAMLDLPLACFTCFGAYFGICWWKTNRITYLMAASLSLGLSFLVKGPIGLYFFAAAAVTGLFVFGKWKRLPSRTPHIVCAIVLLLAICLPWPIMMARLWPNFSQVMGQEMTQRNFGRVDLFSPFSALGGALGLVFPWTLVLVAAVVRTIHRARHNPDTKSLWLVLWYTTSVIPLFFMESFERYMLPVIPPICVLCANWMEEARNDAGDDSQTSGNDRISQRTRTILIRSSAVVVAIAAVFVCGFFLWFHLAIRTSVICLSLTALVLAIAFLTYAPRALALAMALLFAALLGELYPSLGISSMPPGIETVVGSRSAAVFSGTEPAMLSVRLKRSVIPLDTRAQTGPRSLRDFDGFVFMETFEAPKFEAAAGSFPVTFTRAGSFKTFYSRKVWLRFARQDATWADWKKAIEAHSLEELKAEIVFYRVCPREPCS